MTNEINFIKNSDSEYQVTGKDSFCFLGKIKLDENNLFVFCRNSYVHYNENEVVAIAEKIKSLNQEQSKKITYKKIHDYYQVYQKGLLLGTIMKYHDNYYFFPNKEITFNSQDLLAISKKLENLDIPF